MQRIDNTLKIGMKQELEGQTMAQWQGEFTHNSCEDGELWEQDL